MSQASVTKLIPKLRFNVHDRRKLKNPNGPKGRHDKIKKIVTALFKHERIELNYQKADESRGYAERLIADAIKYGDCHKPTMEMASYWIIEKPIIHKLFKVLAPRYQDFTVSYTKLWKAPNVYPGINLSKCVLELRNNIYPPLAPDKSHNKNLIHNVLLEAARNAYHKEKALKEEGKANQVNQEFSQDEDPSVFKENLPFTKPENSCSESEKISSVDKECELSSEENFIDESLSKSENKTVTIDSSSEKELDFKKLNINEEKATESSNEVEKK